MTLHAQDDQGKTKATIEFEKTDRDRDGKISRREASGLETKDGPLIEFFWNIDADKDGYISEREFDTWGMYRNWESEKYNRVPGLTFLRILF